jgi:hypothetical protein
MSYKRDSRSQSREMKTLLKGAISTLCAHITVVRRRLTLVQQCLELLRQRPCPNPTSNLESDITRMQHTYKLLQAWSQSGSRRKLSHMYAPERHEDRKAVAEVYDEIVV